MAYVWVMRVVVFTGAGVSRESGLATFRDSDGLWAGRRTEDVCTPQAWSRDPQFVHDFYNQRRREVRAASPNAAHEAIARLQDHFDVLVVTQNIDNLHERAGSRNVLHLHGEIMFVRPENDDTILLPWEGDCNVGDIHECGEGEGPSQLRPHVVFFGESVPNYQQALTEARNADLLVVVGTSLNVYPAAGIVDESRAKTIYVVDPNPPTVFHRRCEVRYIRQAATEGMPQLAEELIRTFAQPDATGESASGVE